MKRVPRSRRLLKWPQDILHRGWKAMPLHFLGSANILHGDMHSSSFLWSPACRKGSMWGVGRGLVLSTAYLSVVTLFILKLFLPWVLGAVIPMLYVLLSGSLLLWVLVVNTFFPWVRLPFLWVSRSACLSFCEYSFLQDISPVNPLALKLPSCEPSLLWDLLSASPPCCESPPPSWNGREYPREPLC